MGKILCHFCAISITEHTGLSISQVTDEVLYTGLVEMQELEELEECEGECFG